MKCEQVKDLLSAYLDDQLAMKEREDVARHLCSCLSCSAILADFRHFDALLTQLPYIKPDESFLFPVRQFTECARTRGIAAHSYWHLPKYAKKRKYLQDSQRFSLVVLPGGLAQNTVLRYVVRRQAAGKRISRYSSFFPHSLFKHLPRKYW